MCEHVCDKVPGEWQTHWTAARHFCVQRATRGVMDSMFATRGVMVSMSAFLAYHQRQRVSLSLGWGLNFQALVCDIF